MLRGLKKTIQDKVREKPEEVSNKTLTLAADFSLLNVAKAACFCGNGQTCSDCQATQMNVRMWDTAHGIIGEEKRTKRPLFEKTLTDSAPKYFRRSSFSSSLSSAGKWWTSSVLLQFVWTGSSFILLQDSSKRNGSKRNGSKLSSQTSNSEQHSPPVSSDNHYLISNLSPKRAISQANWWCNASWYCLPHWCFWPALCSISKSFNLVPAFAYNHI